VYAGVVRVIAWGTLDGFVRNRVDPRVQRVVREHLDSWHKLVSGATWSSSAELKRQFGTASVVSSDRVVFNIKGNEFRLVVAVQYRFGVVFVLWVGTHREYDRIDVTKVKFDKERYADPTGSN
jgi:mRNA interferase HigB